MLCTLKVHVSFFRMTQACQERRLGSGLTLFANTHASTLMALIPDSSSDNIKVLQPCVQWKWVSRPCNHLFLTVYVWANVQKRSNEASPKIYKPCWCCKRTTSCYLSISAESSANSGCATEFQLWQRQPLPKYTCYSNPKCLVPWVIISVTKNIAWTFRSIYMFKKQ